MRKQSSVETAVKSFKELPAKDYIRRLFSAPQRLRRDTGPGHQDRTTRDTLLHGLSSEKHPAAGTRTVNTHCDTNTWVQHPGTADVTYSMSYRLCQDYGRITVGVFFILSRCGSGQRERLRNAGSLKFIAQTLLGRNKAISIGVAYSRKA